MSTDVREASPEGTMAPEGHGGHPSVAFYILIGAILGIITGVEVAVYYLPQLEEVAVPLLVGLSGSKVMLVIMFFMHLKMDHRSLTWVFLTGATLAALMVSALVILYHILPAFQG